MINKGHAEIYYVASDNIDENGKPVNPVRKNIAYIKNELDPFVDFLNKTFGKDKMKECIEYVSRLKKLT